MPRLARIVIPGAPHHVVQRGNNRQDVFFLDDDRSFYLDRLKENAERFGLTVWGYCLMTNHVHLIVTPTRPDSLAKGIGFTHFRYTQYVNRLHKRSGHLWESRFHSCALDELHFWRAMRYIEQNPVHAGMVEDAWDYEWSSAGPHVGLDDGREFLDLGAWEEEMPAKEWRPLLKRRMRKAEVNALRRHTERGWPLATDGMLAKLEKRLDRRLRPLTPGRPVGVAERKKRKRNKRDS